jgi:hypothetical protein
MSEQNKSQNTVYWNPDADIVVKGAELAALFQVIDLQEVSLMSLPISTLSNIFGLAGQVKTTIVERMNTEGLLFSEPSSVETVEDVETEEFNAPFVVTKEELTN